MPAAVGTPAGASDGRLLLTPAEERTIAAATRRRWRVDASVLALVALVIRIPMLLADRALVFDDGVFGVSALAMRSGALPFRDVFSSQGPLFLPLVFLADLVGLRALDAPRILSVVAGIVVTVAVYACARRLTTRGNALLAAGLATTSGSILWVTGPVNADGPALALSIVAVAVALRYRDVPRTRTAVLVGALGGGAVAVKALAAPAVVVAGLVVLLARRRVLDAVWAALVGIGVYLVAALPWGIDRVWDQSYRYHADAARQGSVTDALAKVWNTLVDRDLAVLVALVLAGVVWALARTAVVPRAPLRGTLRLAPAVAGLVLWAGLVLALLLWEPALWRAHVAHLVVPLALLAALRPPPWRVLAVAAVVVTPVMAVHLHELVLPSAYSGEQAAVVTRLRALPDDARVVSDDPGLVWRSGHRPPADLVDPSFQRIDDGEITAASLARAASNPSVCAVVVTSAKHFGRFDALPERLQRAGYLVEHFGPGITLYARPGCVPA